MMPTRPFSSRSNTPPPVATPGPVTAVDDAPVVPPPPRTAPSHVDNLRSPRPFPTPEPQGIPPVEVPESADDEPRPTRRWLTTVAIALAALVLGALAAAWFTSREETATPQAVDDAIGEAFTSTTVPAPLGPAIYSTVLPSLAFIQAGEPGADDSSIGSGVVINADGLIMTSNHVVEGADRLRITFADGTSAEAQVVQADPAIDIALLQPSTLPEVVVPAVLGGGVRIGDPVYALGNPLGLGGSFSAGVLSGLDRTLPLPDGSELAGLMQFDAAVNPGSSGGPLVDRNGQVVGIVTAIANPTGNDFFSGIGFAVPIDTAGGAAGGPEQ